MGQRRRRRGEVEKKKMKKKKKRQGVQDLNLGCSIYIHNFFLLHFFKNSSMFFKNSGCSFEHPEQQVAPPLLACDHNH
jgi:hypothetical protein